LKFFRSFFFKYIRFLVTGLVFLLIVESGALIYLDRSVLKENTYVSIQKISTNTPAKPAGLKIYLDSTAQQVKASYDGGYLAYTDGEGGALDVINLTDGKKTQIPMAQDMNLSYYKWVYDRDQLIVAETSSGDSDYAKLYNLDADDLADSSEPVEIRNTVQNTDAEIPLASKSSAITDMDFSTSTVTTYLKITGKSDRSILWKFNVPDENDAYSSITVKNIGNIQCLKNESELLYENLDNGRVCVAGQGYLKVDDKTKFRLLGFDGADNVYLAGGSSGTTDAIYYGSIVSNDDSTDGSMTVNLTPDMQKISLSQSVNVDDIYVTMSGGIYVNDSDNNTFTNIVTNKAISYHGSVKCVYGNGFITIDNGEILQNSFE
jgi:hypothetical protein